MKIKKNFSLKKYNSLKIDAKAKLFVEIKTVEELQRMIKKKYFVDNKFFILGEGSNVLFTEDFDGLVVKNSITSVFIMDKDIWEVNDAIEITASSGIKFDDMIQKFLEFQKENNLSIFGLENLAKIPGSVGSAVVQNIGAYGIELKDLFYDCIVVDLKNREYYNRYCILDKTRCCFGYRNSIFKQKENPYFIIKVSFKIDRKNVIPSLNYPALREKFENITPNEITPQLVYDTVSKIRESKLPSKEEYPNAGSFFKNPIITKNKFISLKLLYPDIVFYDLEDETQKNKVKISAAWLIEKCGLKGRRIGDVGISEKHSLILVNYGKATGKEVVNFANYVIYEVKKKIGVKIEPEVVYV